MSRRAFLPPQSLALDAVDAWHLLLPAVERAARQYGCAVNVGDEAQVGAHLSERERDAASILLAVGCCHSRGEARAVGTYARRRLTIHGGALGNPRLAAAVDRLAALLALGGFARRAYAVDLWGGLHELDVAAAAGDAAGDGGADRELGAHVCPGCLMAASRERTVVRRVADVRRLSLLPEARMFAVLPGAAPARLIS